MTIPRCLLFLSIILFTSFFIRTSWSEENEETGASASDSPGSNSIQAIIGKRQVVKIDGINPVAIDDSIMRVEDLGDSSIAITPLVPGTTQIVYWKEGVMHHLSVEVVVPDQLSESYAGPQFVGNKPYLNYRFQNQSSFTHQSFYDNPLYHHQLLASSSLGKGHLTANTSLAREGDITDPIIPDALIAYIDSRKEFYFGETSASFERLFSPVYTGTGFFGGNLGFHDGVFIPHNSKWRDQFNIFSGVGLSDDLKELNAERQVHGLSYSIEDTSLVETNYPNLVNGSFFTYQPEDSNEYHLAGVLEANFHLTTAFSMGVAGNVGPGGFAGTWQTAFEKETGTYLASYTYINHGLEEIDGTIFPNDEHAYLITAQQTLNKGIWLLDASVDHTISVQKSGSDTPSGNVLTAALGLSNQGALRNRYGFDYSFGRSQSEGEVILSNGISGFYTYGIGENAYVEHTLSYSRSDLDSREDRIILNNTLSYELTTARYDFSLYGQVLRGETDSESINLTSQAKYPFRKGNLSLLLSYNKSDLQDNNHQISLGSLFTHNLTSTHQITFNSSLATLITDQTTLSGFIGVDYSIYFGPGVQRDSIFRHLFAGGKVSRLKGIVFVDKNYNGSFEQGEDIPLENIPVYLDQKKREMTGPDGRFQFGSIKEGKDHTVSILPDDIKWEEPLDGSYSYTFSSDLTASGPINLSMAFQAKKASVTVRIYSDVNNNKKLDEADLLIPINNITLVDAAGKERRENAYGGGAIFNGVEKGTIQIGLDPAVIAENLEVIGPINQKLNVTDYTEYEVKFLFKPLRSLRGQVIVPENFQKTLLKKMKVSVGSYSSSIDGGGYYWITNILPGDYTIQIQNLPQKYCLSASTYTRVQVTEEPYAEERSLSITDQCQAP